MAAARGLHLAESRHFGRSARAMHGRPSTHSRQIQRREEDLGQPLFVRDNRTVTLTEAGEELRVFAQHTLLQYQQLRHTIDQQGPSLSGELHIFCSVTAAYSHLPPILDRFRAEQEDDLGQALFVRDNRTVSLTEEGEELSVFAQQTLLQYQQLRHTNDQQGPSLSGDLHIICSVSAAYSHLPPILDRFRAEQPSVEIKLTSGDAADAMEKVVTGEADLAIAGKPETHYGRSGAGTPPH